MASIRERNGKWQARVVRRGYPSSAKSFDSYDDAVKWARKLEVAIDTNTHPIQSSINNINFEELIYRYIREVYKDRPPKDIDIVRLKALANRKVAKYRLCHMQSNVIAAYRDLRLQEVGAGTVIRDLSYISSIWNHAKREWGLTVTNPCSLVKKPRSPLGRNRILSIEEEIALYNVIDKNRKSNPELRTIIQLAIETAMRRGELLNLCWEHVDLSKSVAYLPHSKNGKPRYIPLSSKAVAILQVIKKDSGSVFTIQPQTLHAAFYKAVRRAGLINLRFHDLRHTATTRMAQKLPNVIELASVTGHQSIQMLKRYYHPDAELLARKLG